MSGGEYEYLFIRINTEVESMQENANNTVDSIDVLVAKNKVIEFLKKASNLAYEIEWYDSGDTSEKQFCERVNKILDKIEFDPQ